MKKLIILAMLALGLCATPALATTLDLTDYTSFKMFDYYALPDNLGYFYFSTSPSTSIEMTENGPSITLAPGGSIMFDFNKQKYVDGGITGLSSFIVNMNVSPTVFIVPYEDGQSVSSMQINYLTPDEYGNMTIAIPDSVALLDKIKILNMTMQPITIGVPTPVPAAVWLMGSGLAGIVALRRKIK